MMNRLLLLLTAGVTFSGLLLANSVGGPGPGFAGAPGEPDCSACHGGPATGPGKLTISLAGNAATYTPGQTVALTVTVEDPTATRWGFQLTARKTGSTGNPGGTLAQADASTFLESAGGVDFIGHGNSKVGRASASWTVNWTAPAAGFGSVSFYAAGNASNNNGSETGDKIYLNSLTITEAGGGTGGTPTTATGSHSAPMVAFGGGWSSNLYFVNTNMADASFDVNFVKNDGSGLDVPGGSKQTVAIPARGVGYVGTPSGGGVSQGSIVMNLPDGVTASNLLRLSAQNQPDQELMIPVSKTSDQQKALLLFDDTSINSQLAVSNPGTADANVTMTVRDDKGATAGTSSFKLAPGAKVVFLIKDRVAGAAGKRGTVELSTSTGSVAGVVIRFGGTQLVATEALQEIPQ